jgi:hypothetical protein
MTLVTWGPDRIWLEVGLPRDGSAHSPRTEKAQTLYAESFKEPSYLNAIVGEAEGVVDDTLHFLNQLGIKESR